MAILTADYIGVLPLLSDFWFKMFDWRMDLDQFKLGKNAEQILHQNRVVENYNAELAYVMTLESF